MWHQYMKITTTSNGMALVQFSCLVHRIGSVFHSSFTLATWCACSSYMFLVFFGPTGNLCIWLIMCDVWRREWETKCYPIRCAVAFRIFVDRLESGATAAHMKEPKYKMPSGHRNHHQSIQTFWAVHVATIVVATGAAQTQLLIT